MQTEVVTKRYSGISLPQLSDVGHNLLEQFPTEKIWIFNGEMGAGKTTIIKKICEQLGVVDAMSSPTFTIVNEYLCNAGSKIFHFDFYRLKNEAEAMELGAEEYFYSGNYCFIEWPEKVTSLLPPNYLEIKISIEDPDHRTLEVTTHGH